MLHFEVFQPQKLIFEFCLKWNFVCRLPRNPTADARPSIWWAGGRWAPCCRAFIPLGPATRLKGRATRRLISV